MPTGPSSWVLVWDDLLVTAPGSYQLGAGALAAPQALMISGGPGSVSNLSRRQKKHLDPNVQQVADHIDQASGLQPSEPLEVEVSDSGIPLTDIDIEYPKAIIEVKSGNNPGAIGTQVRSLSDPRVNPLGKQVIVYFTNRQHGPHVAKSIADNGGISFFKGQFNDLVKYLLGLQ